jgi:glycosyltransferase involved in cell wall biosynthesis
MTSNPSDPSHLVVYEPRAEGHHLPWLRFITEDLLSAGCRLTLAVNNNPKNQARIRDHLGPVLDGCQIIHATDPASQTPSQRLASIAGCLGQSGASSVFLCAFDEVASAAARRAFFGSYPPALLRGCMAGIYHRPQFTDGPVLSPNRWLKQVGFSRLLRKHWLRELFVLDADLAPRWQGSYPGTPIHFLPNPCPEVPPIDPGAARAALNLDATQRMFLLYGVGSRRKGLHLAVAAFSELPQEVNALLFCAGALDLDGMPKIKQRLDLLEKQGRARIIDRYVTAAETEQLFAAADFVLLPYLDHFGPSAVMAHAAAAGKPVIASEQNLLGRLVRRHKLGLLFRAGSAPELGLRICEAAAADGEQIQRWKTAAGAYATLYSRSAFRAALVRGAIPASVSSA